MLKSIFTGLLSHTDTQKVASYSYFVEINLSVSGDKPTQLTNGHG